MLSESLFESVFNNSPIGNYLLSPTPEATILAVNSAFLKASARKREELIGKSLFEAFPGNPDDPEDTGETALRRSLARVVETGQPDSLPAQRYPIRVELPNGEVSYEERFWGAHSTPIFGDDGRIACISHTTTDVTEQVMSAAALRESEKRFRALTNATADVVYRMSPDWTQLRYLLGRGFLKDALAPSDFWLDEYIPPEDHALIHKSIEEAIRDKKIFELEHRARRIDGTYGWVLSRAVPMSDANGEIYEWIGAANDITERKEAEKKLKEADRTKSFQLRLANSLLVLNSPEEIMDKALLLLGQELGVSRVFYAEVDDDRGTLFIRRDWTMEGFTSLAGQTKILDDYGPDMIALLRSGQVVANHDVTLDAHTSGHTDAYEKIGVRADLLLPLIKQGKLRVILVLHSIEPRQWHGQEIQLAHDMAERTWSAVEAARAQADLRAERDQSQSIFDGMTEGFGLIDHDWTIVRMNAAGLRLVQRSANEVIGHNHWEVFPDSVGTNIEAACRTAMETGLPQTIETRFAPPGNESIWVEVRVYSAQNGGLAIFFRNITSRKNFEDELKKEARRKDEFLAMLAHELRNPLAPIGAAAGLLQIANLDKAKVQQTSQIIARQVDHMTSLINDLLDVSRVTRGLVQVNNEQTDLKQVVTYAVEQVATLMQSRHHHLTLHLPPEAAMVVGDAKRLVQVIANILTNAAKYTPDGGNIALRMTVPHDQVKVEIVDDGIGMTPDLALHAFDLFSQAERTSDRSQGGLGLGLALVKSLVELHGGSVSCGSPGPGKGSWFAICLPRLEESGTNTTSELEGRSLQDSKKGLRVLVVDDNVDAALMLGMLLETLGYRVMVEHNAHRALQRAKNEKPDICLLDIGLPEMDGNELARRLRSQPETAQSVMVAITGYGQDNDLKQAFDAGFNHHLLKPVDLKKLALILAEINQ